MPDGCEIALERRGSAVSCPNANQSGFLVAPEVLGFVQHLEDWVVGLNATVDEFGFVLAKHVGFEKSGRS